MGWFVYEIEDGEYVVSWKEKYKGICVTRSRETAERIAVALGGYEAEQHPSPTKQLELLETIAGIDPFAQARTNSGFELAFSLLLNPRTHDAMARPAPEWEWEKLEDEVFVVRPEGAEQGIVLTNTEKNAQDMVDLLNERGARMGSSAEDIGAIRICAEVDPFAGVSTDKGIVPASLAIFALDMSRGYEEEG